MKKKQQETIRKTVGDWMQSALSKLGVTAYTLYVIIPTDKDWESTGDVSFRVRRDYPYKSIYVYVAEDSFKNFESKNSNLKDAITHEAVHVLLWEYTRLAESRFIRREELEEKEEEIVDHIANLINHGL